MKTCPETISFFVSFLCVVCFYMHKEMNNQDNQGGKSLTGLLCLTPETLATNESVPNIGRASHVHQPSSKENVRNN